MCPTLKREDWIEVFAKSRRLRSNHEKFTEEEIETKFQNYGQFKVSLFMGQNSLLDEQYHFECERDARRFFQGGPLDPGEHSYRDREYTTERYAMGMGFDRVALYIGGKLIARHSPGASL
jgi:hypothetical protein